MKKAAILLLLMTCVASAQWSDTIDTITTGNFNDIDPQVDNAGLNGLAYPGGILGADYPESWVVFERWYGNSDAISAAKFVGSTMMWDSNIKTISPAETGLVKKFPDVCTLANGMSLATWQEESGSIWNIYYSTCKIDNGNWSSPAALTADTASNSNVEVRAFSDSSFILLWKRRSAILFAVYKSGAFSPIDTLVQTNTDSTQYDLGGSQFIWTTRLKLGNMVCLVGTVTSFTIPAVTISDTVVCAGDISKPRFMVFGGGMPRVFTFNLLSGGRYSAWWSSDPGGTGYVPSELAGDTASSYLNAEFYGPAYLTASAGESNPTILSTPVDFFSWEHQTASDTSVIFVEAGTDTAEQGGNPSISADGFPVSLRTSLGFVVWQSDRSGMSHIYSRSFFWTQTGIDDPVGPPTSFRLDQNYPNPFNPTTNIEFRISNFGFVSLKVYDVLGRLVVTLVNGVRSPGSYEVQFNGSKFASGVYFYRLIAPGVNIVRKMLLEK